MGEQGVRFDCPCIHAYLYFLVVEVKWPYSECIVIVIQEAASMIALQLVSAHLELALQAKKEIANFTTMHNHHV